jgi:hypothetical protein
MSIINPPWWHDKIEMSGTGIIRAADGSVVCVLSAPNYENPADLEHNAALIALAPELGQALSALVSVMRKSDVEQSPGADCDSEEWDAALDDAQSLLDLLAEDGVSFEDKLEG